MGSVELGVVYFLDWKEPLSALQKVLSHANAYYSN
jgi:hypothetical protein